MATQNPAVAAIQFALSDTKNFTEMTPTEWFTDQKPAHVGVYERKWGKYPEREPTFTYWGGTHFGYLGVTPEAALQAWKDSNGRKSCHQNYPWRGVVTEVSQSPVGQRQKRM